MNVLKEAGFFILLYHRSSVLCTHIGQIISHFLKYRWVNEVFWGSDDLMPINGLVIGNYLRIYTVMNNNNNQLKAIYMYMYSVYT